MKRNEEKTLVKIQKKHEMELEGNLEAKSIRNRCAIEVFGGVFVCYVAFWIFSVGVEAFVIELSQISSLFSRTVSKTLKFSCYRELCYLSCSDLNNFLILCS